MKKPYARSERVAGQIQKTLSELLNKKIKDPRLEMATITAVEMARDLKSARIYFSIPGDKVQQEAAEDGFQSALGYVKRSLAARLGLRYMPAIKFFYDDTLDYATRIETVFKMIDGENGPNRSSAEKE